MNVPKPIKNESDQLILLWWRKLPKWLKVVSILISILGIAIIFLGQVVGGVANIAQSVKNKGNDTALLEPKPYTADSFSEPANPTTHLQDPEPATAVLGSSADKAITNFTNWENYEKFDHHEDDNNLLFPTFSKVFPEGRTMYSPFKLGNKFTALVLYRPLSDSRINFVFALKDVFRCIVGNGNYKHIDCETSPHRQNYLFEDQQRQQHAWINRPLGIKPQTTQFLTVTVEPQQNSELLKAVITLKFIPAASKTGEYSTETFVYRIPTGIPSELLSSQIGLGVIDPEKYRDSKADKAGLQLVSLTLTNDH